MAVFLKTNVVIIFSGVMAAILGQKSPMFYTNILGKIIFES
jgi:hypothetical protein